MFDWLWKILLGLVVILVVKKVLGMKKYAKYPPFASGICIPFFGHLVGFGPDPVQFMIDQWKKLGEIWSFQLFGWDCVYMGGTEAQEAFYKAPEDILSARDAYQFTIPAFGKGIIYDAPDTKFQEERKFLGELLSVGSFKKYVPIMEAEVNAYVDEFWKEDSGVIDFSAAISEIIIRTSTHTLQGPEIRAQANQGFAQYMEDIDHALSALAFFYPYLPLPAFKKRNEARKNIGLIVKAIIKQRRANPELHQDEDADVIQKMMSKKYKTLNDTPVSDDEIAGFCVALMLAGQHTSNITSTWLAIHMLTDKRVLQKVIEEQESARPDDSDMTFDHYKKMPYMQACIKETLRIRPPIILVWRKANQDFEYKGYTVPAGTLVCVSPAAFPRMPDNHGGVYTAANEFEPERFQEPRSEDKAKPCSYIAFSIGRHACVGEKFAYLQITTIWSTLLKRFNLKLVGEVKDYPVDPTSMLAGPVGPVKISYERKK